MKRRDFLKYSVVTAAGLTALSHSRVLGANEDIRVGIIGAGIKGCSHANHLLGIQGVRLVAMADPDPGYKMSDCQKKLASAETPVQIDIYTDYRKLLERPDIDAVVIASCNHWHSLHAIDAIKAGKHVYLEKPTSHDIWQGRQMVNLAQKSDLIVAGGLQHRSRRCWAQILEYVKEGHLGKIVCARSTCYKRRGSIGQRSERLVPPTSCDYDLWLGPAQDIPMMRGSFHYDWHWVWNTGNGEIGNTSPHHIDIARILLGQAGYPERVLSIGGREGYDDAGQTPNTHIVFYDYKPFPMISEVRGLPVNPQINAMDAYKKIRIGTTLECEGGYISESVAYDNDGNRIMKFDTHGAEDHLPDFIEAVRNNRPQDLKAPIADSQISSSICHLGNISHRLGQAMPTQEITERIKENALFTDAFQRCVEHLDNNKVDLSTSELTIGPMLSFDGKTEHFTGEFAEQANAYLKDNYREKWAIPQIQ